MIVWKMREDDENCSVLYRVRQLCTLVWAFLISNIGPVGLGLCVFLHYDQFVSFFCLFSFSQL